MNEKTRLLALLAGKNRGLLTTEMDRVKILAAVERLEDHNPIPRPLEAKDLLEGNWRLLYTTNKGILGIDAFPLFNLGQVYQCIRMSHSKLYNLAEIVGVPFFEGLVTVAASFEPVSERRVNVKFERSLIGLQRFLGYRSANQMIEAIESGKKFPPFDFNIESREQSGWLDITYLDEDLRVGRGNEGNVFVLTKEN